MIRDAADLLASDKAINERLDAHPNIDCDLIPGATVLNERMLDIVDPIVEAEAQSLRGIRAKAETLQLGFIYDDGQTASRLAVSLAGDILRLYPVGPSR